MKKNGFTLVEILVVVFVIITLAAILRPILIKALKNDNTCLENPIPIKTNKPTSPYQIVVINGCEYIESNSRTAYGYLIYTLCHKGDCTNECHLKSFIK
jgi:hypothetical protein